jgi:DNA-binding NarL/FixJ family response regulator
VEVLRLLAKGLRNKDVARAIGRTEATVKAHVLHILQKLEVADRTEAVTVALQRGIIHLD